MNIDTFGGRFFITMKKSSTGKPYTKEESKGQDGTRVIIYKDKSNKIMGIELRSIPYNPFLEQNSGNANKITEKEILDLNKKMEEKSDND